MWLPEEVASQEKVWLWSQSLPATADSGPMSVWSTQFPKGCHVVSLTPPKASRAARDQVLSSKKALNMLKKAFICGRNFGNTSKWMHWKSLEDFKVDAFRGPASSKHRSGCQPVWVVAQGAAGGRERTAVPSGA